MNPKKIREFGEWDAGLMVEKMGINGEPFTLGKDKTERTG